MSTDGFNPNDDDLDFAPDDGSLAQEPEDYEPDDVEAALAQPEDYELDDVAPTAEQPEDYEPDDVAPTAEQPERYEISEPDGERPQDTFEGFQDEPEAAFDGPEDYESSEPSDAPAAALAAFERLSQTTAQEPEDAGVEEQGDLSDLPPMPPLSGDASGTGHPDLGLLHSVMETIDGRLAAIEAALASMSGYGE